MNLSDKTSRLTPIKPSNAFARGRGYYLQMRGGRDLGEGPWESAEEALRFFDAEVGVYPEAKSEFKTFSYQGDAASGRKGYFQYERQFVGCFGGTNIWVEACTRSAVIDEAAPAAVESGVAA